MDVSVFIPVHNGEKYLAQAIESVLGQTHRELELVVIDDGSTDGSLAIMERYARADRRVRVFTQENRGVTATGNRGLEEARGDWVARLDADDLFFPEKIERQLAFVKRHPDLRIAGTRGWFINDRGRSLGLVGTEGPFTREEFLRRRQSGEPVYFIHSSTLMHRETMLAIGGYRTQFVQAEDVDLWLRAAERGHLLLKTPGAARSLQDPPRVADHGQERRAEALSPVGHGLRAGAARGPLGALLCDVSRGRAAPASGREGLRLPARGRRTPLPAGGPALCRRRLPVARGLPAGIPCPQSRPRDPEAL